MEEANSYLLSSFMGEGEKRHGVFSFVPSSSHSSRSELSPNPNLLSFTFKFTQTLNKVHIFYVFYVHSNIYLIFTPISTNILLFFFHFMNNLFYNSCLS
jgi:hypothetical protein